VLHSASANLYLTDVERLGLAEVAGTLAALAYLPNGVPAFESRGRPAKSPDGSTREVLFLARLAPRKRPEMFVRAALRLIDEFPDVDFTLVGPDEGALSSVTTLITTSTNPQARRRIRWEGSVEPEAAAARIAAAELYVLPSVDEPFPMSVLEAMSSGTPVIVTESCGLAPDIRAHRAGAVIDHTLDALVDSLRGFLSRPESVRECGDNASRLARDRFGMAAVAGELVQHYARAVAR
jgi:glycosyltransferase involved in cell wall biosynthesis